MTAKRLRQPTSPRSNTVEYNKLLQKMTRETNRIFRVYVLATIQEFPPPVAPDKSEEFQKRLSKMLKLFALLSATLMKRTQVQGARILVQAYRKDRVRAFKTYDKFFGTKMKGVVEQDNLKAALALKLKENKALIRSLSERTQDALETAVMSKVTTMDWSPMQLIQIIKKARGISDRRAKFIAKDQMHKLLTGLAEIRARNAGAVSYVWRNMGDRRVRGNPDGLYPKVPFNHWTREGKMYQYNAPPADGNPGQPPGCRCHADPIFEVET